MSSGDRNGITWALPMQRPQPPAPLVRYYRDRFSCVYVRCFSGLAVLLAIIIAAAPRLSAVERVSFVVGALLGVWIARTGGSTGVGVTRAGLWLDYGFFARWLMWDDIDSIIPVPFGPWAAIRVRTHNRPAGYRVALVQGRKMHWEGGSTRNVLAALRADLAKGREGQLGDTPSLVPSG